jgi:hypothetical protein
MRPAGDNWFVRASKWVYGKVKTGVQFQWSLSKQPYSKTMDAMGLMVGKTKQAASSIWNWAKDHKLLAAGIGLGVALVGLFFRKSLWNWVIAPAIRIASNTAFGYAIGGKTGAVIGFVMGTVHGFAMAKAGSYDWKSGWGWLAFAADNTWSLFNSFIASGFATLNVGWNEIDDSQSKDSNALYFKSGWIPDKDTTLGNVIVGNTVPKHESVHVWQARVLGPIYVPAVAAFYEIATVLPYWLLYGDCSVTGVGSYFMQGVYPNTLHELMAYAFEGNPC